MTVWVTSGRPRRSLAAVAVVFALGACNPILGIDAPTRTTIGANCPAQGEERCVDACVDPLTDPTHCGTCGNVCPEVNGQRQCRAGTCVVCPESDPGCQLECTEGTVRCGQSCHDLSSDPKSCGTCGHSCGGGECHAGVCQPLVLIGGIGAVQRIVRQGDGLLVQAFDATFKPQLLRVHADGPPCVADSEGDIPCRFPLPDGRTESVDALAVGPRHGLLALRDGMVLITDAAMSSARVAVASGPTHRAAVMDDTHAYWSSADGVAVWRQDLEGEAPPAPLVGQEGATTPGITQMVSLPGGELLLRVEESAGDWPAGIYLVPREGCVRATCRRIHDGRVQFIDAIGDQVHWSQTLVGSTDRAMIRRRAIHDSCTGSACETTVIAVQTTNTGQVVEFAADGRHLYWTDRGSVRRAPLGQVCDVPECGERFLALDDIPLTVTLGPDALYASKVRRPVQGELDGTTVSVVKLVK